MKISSCQTITIATQSAPRVFLGISLPEFVAELLAPLQTRLVSWALPRTAHWLRPGAPRAKVLTAIEPSNPVGGSIKTVWLSVLRRWLKASVRSNCRIEPQWRQRGLLGGCSAGGVGRRLKKNYTKNITCHFMCFLYKKKQTQNEGASMLKN